MNPNRTYQVYRPSNLKSPSTKEPTPKKGKRLSFAIASVFALVALVFGGHLFLSSKATARDKALELAAAQKRQSEKDGFAKKVELILNSNPEINFSITAVDLSNGQKQSFGNQKPMEAASTGKLITATLLIHLIEQKKYSFDQKIGGSKISYLLENLINKSDDTAWEILNEELGHKALKGYADSIGINSYDPDENVITTADMATLLQKLQEGKLLNAQNTQRLRTYMTNTNYEDFITPALPAGSDIHHKVGLSDDYVNDAAIISSGSRTYILVIFSYGNQTYNWDHRALLMQKITTLSLPAYL